MQSIKKIATMTSECPDELAKYLAIMESEATQIKRYVDDVGERLNFLHATINRLKSYSKSHYFAYPNKESPKSVKLLVNHFENVFSQAEESATSATDTIRQTNDSIDTDRQKTVAESSWTMIDSNDQPNGFTSKEFGSEIGSQSSSTDETDQRNAFPEIINDFEPNEEHEYSSREITIENIDQSTTESLESSCTNTTPIYFKFVAQQCRSSKQAKQRVHVT